MNQDFNPLFSSNRPNRESGVTLLLSVLVLAAITAIAFSLAAIITVEIRSSGDILRTEPALYAVQGVTEEAFFKYARSVSNAALDVTACQPASLNVCSINGVSLSQPPPAVRQFDPAPRVDVIPTTTTNRYLFVDPAKPNDYSQAFSNISVTQLNSVPGASATFTKCCDGAGNKIIIRTDSLAPNDLHSLTISGSGQYEIAVQNSSSTSPLLVQIDAQLSSDGSHKIPLVGRTSMDITASYLGLSRKYFISIPFATGGSQ